MKEQQLHFMFWHMMCELRGGPLDGAFVVLPKDFGIWDDDDLEIKAQTAWPVVAWLYRWLFGEADHLDFAGWRLVEEQEQLRWQK